MNYYLISKILNTRTQLTLGMLMLILQRSPAIKLLIQAKSFVKNAPSVRIIQSYVLPATALAAPHAISGATGATAKYTIQLTDTPEVKVGLSAVIQFEVSITPESWTFAGEIPPGLRLTDLRNRVETVDNLLVTSKGVLRGVPTEAGIFQLTLTPWENPDGSGGTADEPLVLNIVVAEGELLEVATPALAYSVQDDALTLKWENNAQQGFQLQTSTDFVHWTNVTQDPQVHNNQSSIQIPITSGDASFYQLKPSL